MSWKIKPVRVKKCVSAKLYRLSLIVRVIAESLISRSRSFDIKLDSTWGLTNRLQKADPQVKRHQPFALFSYSHTNIPNVRLSLGWVSLLVRRLFWHCCMSVHTCVLYWWTWWWVLHCIFLIFKIILLPIQNVHCDFVKINIMFF